MKNLIKIFIVSISLMLSSNLFAQDASFDEQPLTKQELRAQKRLEKKKEREQKKLIAKQLELIIHENAVRGIDSASFVLEATQVYDRYGNVENVNSNINFVKVVGNKAVFQLGFDGVVGLNGVGGITMEGTISGYEVEKLDNGRVNVKCNVQGPIMMANMSFTMDGEGNFANVKVRAQTENIELSFRGQIQPNNHSSVYEGMKLF
ncbi:DUF4251 domain-containing protein [Flammeovirga aprica]|uniref:DUF4251 domain-containing protein n=1 Tax=Flammeovirga aprica JL-4 TaxID=694437 RepID=A0A7X9RTE5_9BACT|nr:DUF4251 domain-containing protein [Flammeovirga aprica]NME68385.1 DUF4251 domain-containing protein [Flammeovirga aprica JL-4]